MRHKTIKLNVLLFFSFLLLTGISYSQEVKLEEYVALVEKGNLDLKLSTSQIDIAREEVNIAKAAILPNIDVNGSYQRDFNKNFLFINDPDGGSLKFRTNFNNTVDVNAIVDQTVFDPQIFAGIKMVKLTEELSKLNHQNNINEMEANAASLYWQAVFARESIDVLIENTNLAKTQYNQVQTMYKTGTLSKLELQQFEILYQKTIPVLKSAQAQYKSLLNELKVLANLPLTSKLILTDNLETIQNSSFLGDIDESLEQQPQLIALKKEIEIIEHQISGQKKFWVPKLNLVAGYDFSSQDNKFNFGQNTNQLFFGQLGISIPIFSGGRNKAEIAKSKIVKENATQQFIQREQTFLKELQNTEYKYYNAVENIDLHTETIRLSQDELAILSKQLTLGVITPIELKESRLRLIQGKLELLNSYLDLHIAKLQIRRITGTQH